MKKQLVLIISAVLILCSIFSVSAQESDSLTDAYKREFIYLDNEIRLLQHRIQDVETDGDQRIEAARDELNRLEVTLLNLQDDVEKEQKELNFLEDQESDSTETFDTIETIIIQAVSKLQKYDVETKAYSGNADEQTANLGEVFSESLKLLSTLGSITVKEEPFFLPDGKTVDGKIAHVGQIAAMGTGDNIGGTLAPAGGGMFHLVREDFLPQAKEIINGKHPASLPLFLFESSENLIETSKGKTLKDTIDGGGIIGLVIIAMGFLALVLIVIRALGLSGINKGNKEEYIDDIADKVESGALQEALVLCSKLSGALNRVITATVNGLIDSPKKVEDSIAESVLNEQPALNRFRSAISVFAAVAPLLGLLGTVTGMISTFEIITIYGTGDPKLLSGGISEALVTTEFGLVVAIPTLLLGNLLSAWSDSISSKLEISALRLVNASSGFKRAKKAVKKAK